MSRIKNKLLSLILIVVLTITVIPQMTGAQAEEQIPQYFEIEYDFANADPGNAYGKITVTSPTTGQYKLYWGDEKGNKLQYNGVEFSEFGTCTLTTTDITDEYQIPSPYTAIPEGAEKVLVVNDETQVVWEYNIPENKQFNEGKLSYKFGVMSDVHFNRYKDYSKDDAVDAFNTAMKFVSDQGIDFVGVAGDLSSNGEQDSYDKFNATINKYPNITVYTITGNHDTRNLAGFKKSMNTKAKTDKNIKTIANEGLDFIYEKNGDIFVFLSQIKWAYGSAKYSILLENEQLNWLEKNLNTYAGKNVYVFFHSYFASENGDVTTAVGNLINPGGYTYDLTYTFGGQDETRFRRLLNKYPNVTVFSGHSHWAYNQQKYNPNLNIGNIKANNTGATLVHVSSVTEPRTIDRDSAARKGQNGVMSEGTVALKYKNSTVYMGVDFKNGKYLSYATYLSKDGKKGTPVPAITTGKTKITKVGKVKKVSKKSKKYKVTIKFRKVASAYKYQIQYSTGKKFKAKKTKTKYSAKTKYTITKLKKNTKYYIRVRAYRYQFGERVYGAWSKVKKVKTPKKTKK